MSNSTALLVLADEIFAGDVELLLDEMGVVSVKADSDRDAVRLIAEFTPDLLLLELNRPMREIVRLLTDLQLNTRAIPIVWISEDNQNDAASRVQRSGARGLINKHAPPDLIIHGIRTVLRGQTFFANQNTCPATPDAKGVAQSERLLKVLRKEPETEVALDGTVKS